MKLGVSHNVRIQKNNKSAAVYDSLIIELHLGRHQSDFGEREKRRWMKKD